MTFRIKRVYEPPDASDGRRVLVDRLWPRGLARASARIDDWARDIAPSAELRRWFAHDIARWPGFVERYAAELSADPALQRLDDLRRHARAGPVTLLFAARDAEHCNAAALLRVLNGKRAGGLAGKETE